MTDYIAIEAGESFASVSAQIKSLVDSWATPSWTVEVPGEIAFQYRGSVCALMWSDGPFCSLEGGAGHALFNLLAARTSWGLVLEDDPGEVVATRPARRSSGAHAAC
ncbi:MAG: hypothetical protein WCP28_16935 [Actinomycetes bacterium]